MLKILGEHYYIDLESAQSIINIDTPNSSGSTEQQIGVVQYEIIKMMLEVVLSETEEVDETLGDKSSASIPFKLAFNTLLNNKIIQKY
jgi:hypothetical protein